MQTTISNDNLVNLISRFGAKAIEARQVSKRLNTLLENRLLGLKREHRRTTSAMKAERMALADNRMETFINESVELTYQAHFARIQYETHAMLYKARQSMRGLRSLQPPVQRQRPEQQK